MEAREETHKLRRGGREKGTLANVVRGFRAGLTHFSTNVGKRETGQSARAKYEYNNREGKYADQPDKLTYAESGNMPAWAQDKPLDYWIAADENERENGRLYVNAVFALPRDLSAQDQVELAREQCRAMARTIDGKLLPYSMAIHDGNGHNPHFHVEISERTLDGNDRTPETWFKRHPIGAEKSVDLQARDWIPYTRREWCERANKYLEAAGSESRLDHRTLKEQGEDRIATIHVGYTDPAKPHVRNERAARNEAIKLANRLPEASRAVAQADERIAKAEAAIADLKATLREIEAKAAAEKAAASMPEPDASRQVHDLAQLGPERQTQEKTDQTQQKSAQPQAFPEQTPQKSTQTQEKTGQTQKINEPQAPQVSASEIHAPDLPRLALAPATVQKLDDMPFDRVRALYEQRQAKAELPAPTFESALAKQPAWQKAQDEHRAALAGKPSPESLEHYERQKYVHDAAKQALEKDKAAHAKASDEVGAFNFMRLRQLKNEGEELQQREKALAEQGRQLLPTEKALQRVDEAERALGSLRNRELEPDSATQQQLAQDQAAHTKATRELEAWTPYMVERQQRETGQTQAAPGASLAVEQGGKEQGQGRGLELVKPGREYTSAQNAAYSSAGKSGQPTTSQAQDYAAKRAAERELKEKLDKMSPAERRKWRKENEGRER